MAAVKKVRVDVAVAAVIVGMMGIMKKRKKRTEGFLWGSARGATYKIHLLDIRKN